MSYNALNHSSITGGYNTVLGAYAGGHGGNSNVLIGYYSGWGNEDSNKLFISSGRTYTGSNTEGGNTTTSSSLYQNYLSYRPHVLIEGDFEDGNLIFGRPSAGTTTIKNDADIDGNEVR